MLNEAGLFCWGWFVLSPLFVGAIACAAMSWKRRKNDKDFALEKDESPPPVVLSPVTKLMHKMLFGLCISVPFYVAAFAIGIGLKGVFE